LKQDKTFANAVYSLIAQVPAGNVVSYSQVAVLCGHPGAARVVGQIAHFGPPDLPWHRLVYADGKMANGYVPGGPAQQMRRLTEEGVDFMNQKVNMKVASWWPNV
jgi:methylated-DNA-protein-cysteine methyltransferase related protein